MTKDTQADEVNNDNIVTLSQPIMRGKQSIESLELTKPDAGSLSGLNLMQVTQADVDSLAKLVPRISNPAITSSEFKKLEPCDLLEIATKITLFFIKPTLMESV